MRRRRGQRRLLRAALTVAATPLLAAGFVCTTAGVVLIGAAEWSWRWS